MTEYDALSWGLFLSRRSDGSYTIAFQLVDREYRVQRLQEFEVTARWPEVVPEALERLADALSDVMEAEA
jgi:hypothetical protein